MAVKHNNRQRALFSTDDDLIAYRSIDPSKACSKCGDIKSADQFYPIKRKDGTKRLAPLCKSCDNAKRQRNTVKAKGSEYRSRVDRSREAKERREAEREQRRCEKTLRENQFGEWTQAIQTALSHSRSNQKEHTRNGWARKCCTAVVSLRKRTHRGSGKEVRKCTTWQKRCKAAKANLKASVKRQHQDAWKKKCSTCALNHKRKHKGPSRHIVSCGQ